MIPERKKNIDTKIVEKNTYITMDKNKDNNYNNVNTMVEKQNMIMHMMNDTINSIDNTITYGININNHGNDDNVMMNIKHNDNDNNTRIHDDNVTNNNNNNTIDIKMNSKKIEEREYEYI